MSDHLLCICCIFSEHFLSWEHLWRVACVNGVSSILILYLDVSTVCHLYLISCFILFFNIKSSHRRCSVRKVFLEISQNSHKNTSNQINGLVYIYDRDFRNERVKKEKKKYFLHFHSKRFLIPTICFDIVSMLMKYLL